MNLSNHLSFKILSFAIAVFGFVANSYSEEIPVGDRVAIIKNPTFNALPLDVDVNEMKYVDDYGVERREFQWNARQAWAICDFMGYKKPLLSYFEFKDLNSWNGESREAIEAIRITCSIKGDWYSRETDCRRGSPVVHLVTSTDVFQQIACLK